jgi:CAAX amino terminal protease family.
LCSQKYKNHSSKAIKAYFCGNAKIMNSMFSLLKGKTAGFEVLIYLFILLISSLIGLLFTTLVTSTMGAGTNTIKLTQAISSTMMFICPPFVFYLLTKNKPIQELGFRKVDKLSVIFAATCIMFVALPIINLLTTWNESMQLPKAFATAEKMMKEMEDKAAVLTEQMLNVTTIGGLLINILVMALIPAIGEELTFRSVIQQFLVKTFKNAHVGIFLAAFIFSAIHLQFYGFLPRMLLGLFLGYFFYCSKSIWVPILMHFLNNGTAVIIYYLNNIGKTQAEMDSFGSSQNVGIIVISAILTIGLLVYAWKQKQKKALID